MIVYCALPVRGDTTYQEFSRIIIDHINSLKHTALSELNVDFKPAAPLTDSEIFSRDTKWLEKSKIVIAEVSGASTGVGFEIAYALFKKKIPVLALANSNGKSISAMINGCHSDLLSVQWYDDAESLKRIVSNFLKENEE